MTHANRAARNRLHGQDETLPVDVLETDYDFVMTLRALGISHWQLDNLEAGSRWFLEGIANKQEGI